LNDVVFSKTIFT